MKIAYFDTIGGIAGDMTLGAFVSAGLPIDDLTRELRKLPVEGYELIGRRLHRNAIEAVHIDVVVSHPPHLHRDLKSILALIQGSTLSDRVKADAAKIFTVIGEAEAKIHGVPLDRVHFHEVGALDSLVDIVGAAICLEAFAIERVYSSPVRIGRGGFVSTQHGAMPTPTPATLEILRDYPVQFTDIPQELTTPTGAGILKALSTGVLRNEEFLPGSVGYGAGTKEIAEVPNLLRVAIGDVPAPSEADDIVTVETNIDDMNPQVYPFLIEELLGAGAHDAYLIPIIMKKGRPGILLSVMVPKPSLPAIESLIYRHTTTIGLRIQSIGRKKLPRLHLDVATSFGTVKAKVVVREGREVVTPEFEECKRIARERGLPLPEVMRRLDREIAEHRQP
jgi:uncharacterized protein (TIGR00299 family) protein